MLETEVIARDQDILGGTPVFPGTRVPVQTLLDYLAGGDNLEEFLDDFPSVRREQAVAVLALSGSATVFDRRDADMAEAKQGADSSLRSE